MRLNELIQKYCPNGVEFVRMGDISQAEKEKNSRNQCDKAFSITKGGLMPTGEYFKKANVTSNDTTGYRIVKPNWFVYSPSRIDVGSINYLRVNYDVIVSPLNVVFSIDEKRISPEYLLHYLNSRFGTWQILNNIKGIEGTGRKLLPFEVFSTFEVPVPPLPVQAEIVRILDNFTELTAELTAELAMRKKQYEYYRDELFNFGNDVIFKTLPELSENYDRQRKPVTKGNREKGQYPYYGASGIVDYVADYIFDGDYLLISEDGANLVARSTPIAFSISGKNWVNNHAHVLKFDTHEMRKYVEFFINSIDLSKYISGGAQPKLNQDNLNKILIPTPPFNQVKKIVDILTRFDQLCNDITEGLPAEIAARQKQYEYYRDKLLSFKENS